MSTTVASRSATMPTRVGSPAFQSAPRRVRTTGGHVDADISGPSRIPSPPPLSTTRPRPRRRSPSLSDDRGTFRQPRPSARRDVPVGGARALTSPMPTAHHVSASSSSSASSAASHSTYRRRTMHHFPPTEEIQKLRYPPVMHLQRTCSVYANTQLGCVVSPCGKCRAAAWELVRFHLGVDGEAMDAEQRSTRTRRSFDSSSGKVKEMFDSVASTVWRRAHDVDDGPVLRGAFFSFAVNLSAPHNKRSDSSDSSASTSSRTSSSTFSSDGDGDLLGVPIYRHRGDSIDSLDSYHTANEEPDSGPV